MKIGIKVRALKFPDVESMPGAWRNYIGKHAVTIKGCSNDDDLQLIQFKSGHVVYWNPKYLKEIK